jgi:hypothetical protein
VVIFDLAVVVIIMIFIYKLRNSQLRYVQQFKQETIEMDDFSICLENVPVDEKYMGDEHLLRAFLTQHFEGVLKEHIRENYHEEWERVDLDSQEWKKKWEVADICFGKEKLGHLGHLMTMADIRQQYVFIRDNREPKATSDKEISSLEKQKEKLETKFSKLKNLYVEAEETEGHLTTKDRSIRFAYIVFRSMKAIDYL